MIIKDLYTYGLRNHGDHTIDATIRINENSTVYDGHFPQFAITPGVCQVLMIKEILEGELDVPMLLKGAKYIKFTSMHEPVKAREIDARIRYTGEGNRIMADGLLYRGDTTYLKFKGEFVRQP